MQEQLEALQIFRVAQQPESEPGTPETRQNSSSRWRAGSLRLGEEPAKSAGKGEQHENKKQNDEDSEHLVCPPAPRLRPMDSKDAFKN